MKRTCYVSLFFIFDKCNVVILFYILDKLNEIMWYQIFRSERKLYLKNFRMQQQICPTVFRLNVIQ